LKVELSGPAKKDLRKLSSHDRQMITRELARYRRGQAVDIKKLRGSDDVWRLRAGDYRIIFEQWRPDDKGDIEAFVLRIVSRKDAYR
jgi:mRNA-degrading endonuclease RelE of RelBE toxin-antitoxin system